MNRQIVSSRRLIEISIVETQVISNYAKRDINAYLNACAFRIAFDLQNTYIL